MHPKMSAMQIPQALQVAVAAAQAVERVGMPESQLILSQAAIYVACAPKSNAATNAIFSAMESVKNKKASVPPYLQDAHYGGAGKLGRGIGYEYAHDFRNISQSSVICRMNSVK